MKTVFSMASTMDQIGYAVGNALSVRDNKIAELEAIIAKHNLCHDQHGKVGAREFADSCAHEQRKIFGAAPDADLIQQVIPLLQKIEWITAIHDTAQCPYCNRQQHRGHTDTCELKLLLDRFNAEADPGRTEESGESPIQGAPGCRE